MNEDNDLPDISHGQVLTITTAQSAVFVIVGMGLWYFTDRSLAHFLTVDLAQIAYGTALGLGLAAVGIASLKWFRGITDKLIKLQGDTYFFLKDKLSPDAIIWISICAGVGEEALFRGGVQTVLSDYLGSFAGIVIASTAFAVVHMAKPAVALIIFAIGGVFGVIYWYSESLLIVMIGHAVYDVFALAYVQKRLHELKHFGP